MFDQAFRLLDHHLGHLNVARGGLVEGGRDHLALHRALHVGDFLRALVDQEHDQVAVGVVGGDRLGDVLEDDRLAGARLRGDERALAHAQRRHDVDHPAGLVLDGGVLEFEDEALGGIERRQIVEMDLVLAGVGILEIDGRDLQQREIALAVLGAPDRSLDGVARPQAEAADLRGRDVDVVGAGEIVRFRAAQEAEAVLEDFEHAVAGDLDIAFGELLEDGEHHVLLAHGRRVFDFEFLRELQKLVRLLRLQILEFHRLEAGLDCHWGVHLGGVGR